MPTIADVVEVLESAYDPRWAESWDAVGLVCGDPFQPVTKILFAVDPVAAVADEAVSWGADLIVAHHPLYLRGTTSVAATTFKGRLVHTLIKNDIGLYTAHTNADVADPGVSDALARAVGLTGPLVPLSPAADDPRRGLGRIGSLPAPMSLRDFAGQAARGLPGTAGGLRVAGDPGREVRRVAVSGERGLPARHGPRRRGGRVPHRGPAPPPGQRVHRGRRGRGRARPDRRGPLGHRVALAGRRGPDRGVRVGGRGD
nr:hypothetical protein GCM10020093_042180 [Planobispora longispora]